MPVSAFHPSVVGAIQPLYHLPLIPGMVVIVELAEEMVNLDIAARSAIGCSRLPQWPSHG